MYLMYPYGKQDLIPDIVKWEKSEQDLGSDPLLNTQSGLINIRIFRTLSNLT